MSTQLLQARIGAALRKQRELQQVSQDDFAERVGMHRSYYGALERGKKNLQLSTLQRVCVALDVPMWQVVKDAEVTK